MRAAGAIAEHHEQRGDRGTLRVFGSSSARPVPAASGRNQLRRILDELSGIRGGSDPSGFRRRGHVLAPADSLLILFSPLVSVAPLDRAVALARRGVAVVVVDTLPEHVTDDEDPLTTLAWWIRLLERNCEVRRAEVLGVAVVAWRGPGIRPPRSRSSWPCWHSDRRCSRTRTSARSGVLERRHAAGNALLTLGALLALVAVTLVVRARSMPRH